MIVILTRRKFLAALGGAAGWPLAARSQQTAKLPTIGFFGSAPPLSEGQRIATGSVCTRANTLLAQLKTLGR
jgi:hypothetical protein